MGRKTVAIGLIVWLLSIALIHELPHAPWVGLSGLVGLYPGVQNHAAAGFSSVLFYGWVGAVAAAFLGLLVHSLWRNNAISGRIFVLLFFVSTWAYLLRFHMAQFNERPALDAAMTLGLHFEASWCRASEADRSVAL